MARGGENKIWQKTSRNVQAEKTKNRLAARVGLKTKTLKIAYKML